MPLSRYSESYDPDDLALLQRVFNRLCAERRLAVKDKEQREALAAELIGVFAFGITDETQLWHALSKRRKA